MSYPEGGHWMSIRKTMQVEDVQRSLGERIRELRKRSGWSQEQFAERCGLHRTYMGHVERGLKNVSLTTVVRICDALGIRLSDLFSLRKRVTPMPEMHARRSESKGANQPGFPEVRRMLNQLRREIESLQEAVQTLAELGNRLRPET